MSTVPEVLETGLLPLHNSIQSAGFVVPTTLVTIKGHTDQYNERASLFGLVVERKLFRWNGKSGSPKGLPSLQYASEWDFQRYLKGKDGYTSKKLEETKGGSFGTEIKFDKPGFYCVIFEVYQQEHVCQKILIHVTAGDPAVLKVETNDSSRIALGTVRTHISVTRLQFTSRLLRPVVGDWFDALLMYCRKYQNHFLFHYKMLIKIQFFLQPHHK